MILRAADQPVHHRVQAAQVGVALFHPQTAPQAVQNGFRLFVYLLEHEMVVAALLDLGQGQGDLLHLLHHLLVPDGLDGAGILGDAGDLVVVQIDHLPGVLHQGGGVGGDEVLALAQPDHERAAAAGGDDLVRFFEISPGCRRSPPPPAGRSGRRRRGPGPLHTSPLSGGPALRYRWRS